MYLKIGASLDKKLTMKHKSGGVFPAGSAVVAAVEVEEIVRAERRDLGMPETLWNCRVKEFGPLIVSIDSEGRNYFEEKKLSMSSAKTNKWR